MRDSPVIQSPAETAAEWQKMADELPFKQAQDIEAHAESERKARLEREAERQRQYDREQI